ncbi:hypothetical protein PIIN_04267 [Serendipita indica DSM 11827]|uniref:Uncharacterized protein n=1 Tax=Serendipita indica (strain DSM 11827) TaxID=1109443 RepID=G4TG82_SERID|nr:hypothetical protein PIIN_04267 [Serendipita indica DSM 11827]
MSATLSLLQYVSSSSRRAHSPASSPPPPPSYDEAHPKKSLKSLLSMRKRPEEEGPLPIYVPSYPGLKSILKTESAYPRTPGYAYSDSESSPPPYQYHS